MVRRIVIIKAVNPFPAPWNMAEESMPKATVGKKIQTTRSNWVRSPTMRDVSPDHVKIQVIWEAKRNVNTARTLSTRTHVFKANK